ncbi:hypothetical protein RhiJN_08893 [Ceratobasidium sp. AG-Ba]|nr:hypothetical protein RhiJN_08893 [Ceratobasidium sp. AG-Ba]
MPEDYFRPFASGDRPQPAPLLPSDASAVLLYLGAGLDLYPIAARFAGFSNFLYVDAKPRLTRAPGHQDHASWRAPADVARAVIERAAGNLDRDGWELIAPEVLRFRGPDGIVLHYVFATLDFELVSRATSMPTIAKLLQRVEALYVHGLYITPETNLHLPALRTVYAIPGNASCADVDFIAEHDCTPPTPSSPLYVPTKAEREHYEKLCAWAGVRVDGGQGVTRLMAELAERERERAGMDKAQLEKALEVERHLQSFIGLAPSATIPTRSKPPKPPKQSRSKSKTKQKEPKIAGIYEYPVPASSRPSNISSSRPSGESSASLPNMSRKPSPIPHVLPPLPFSVSTPTLEPPKRFSRPKSGGGSAQGLVRSNPVPPKPVSLAPWAPSEPRTSAVGRSALEEAVRPVVKTGGYRIAKTVREAEAVWLERETRERGRLEEEERMRERMAMGVAPLTKPKARRFLKFLAGGVLDRDPRERGHAHTV